MTAVQFDEARQAWNVVGKLTANLTGKCQTVPRGEATALLYCLKATRNSVKFVTDAQCMWHRCVSTFTHSDLWSSVKALACEQRLHANAVADL